MTRIFKYKVWRGKIYYLFKITSPLPHLQGPLIKKVVRFFKISELTFGKSGLKINGKA